MIEQYEEKERKKERTMIQLFNPNTYIIFTLFI